MNKKPRKFTPANTFLLTITLFLACLILYLPAGNAWAEEQEIMDNGQDITRPRARFDLRYEYSNAPDPGSHDDSHIITLRMDKPFVLSEHWVMATRIDLPLMFTNRYSDDNKHGNVHFGLSDMLVQALVANIVTPRFGWAFGAQLVFPTATEDGMGAGKYRVVPTLGMRWKTDEMLRGSWFALAARWDKDFAESRSDSTEVDELQFAPMVNIPLSPSVFINLFPSSDIRYNMGDKRSVDSGRWFVPFDILVGKMLNKNTVASLEVSVPIIDDYDVYDFKTELRVGFFF